MPRQKLPAAYIQNGAVNIIKPEVIMQKNSMTGDPIKALVMDADESVSIDTALDWQLAEILMARRKAKSQPGFPSRPSRFSFLVS